MFPPPSFLLHSEGNPAEKFWGEFCFPTHPTLVSIQGNGRGKLATIQETEWSFHSGLLLCPVALGRRFRKGEGEGRVDVAGKENWERGQRANVRVTDKLRSDDSDCMNLPSQRTHFHDRQCLWLEALHTGCACAGQRLPVLAQVRISFPPTLKKGMEKTELRGTGHLSFH
ncbi:Hypothetical predicted protein [Podarcis lilfordi]|uniref:Uncharacterized protein n=1 Tax=Podarcis lilfordi TaxID=74358 RepID=A0AA35KZX7_9SAUR|nr:Hypothetical predicted protein [Podarcis lilfordi]